MIELSLRQTWYNIGEHCSSKPVPLRIVEIINHISPRSWSFRFSFGTNGRTNIEIDCHPALSDADALALVASAPEELFFAERLHLRQNSRYFTSDVGEALDKRQFSNVAVFRSSEHSGTALLVVEGAWRSNIIPTEVQSSSVVRDYMWEHTWMGSPSSGRGGHEVQWKVLATDETIYPGDRYEEKLGHGLVCDVSVDLTADEDVHLGNATFRTSPTLQNEGVYSIFGPLDMGYTTRRIRRASDQCWVVEVGGKALEDTTFVGAPTAGLVRGLALALDKAQIQVEASAGYQAHVEALSRKQLIVAAERLKERQERALAGERVTIGGDDLMLVPSNENEVLVLLCKMEALGLLPFHHFRLWEYTAKVGIDALATYQLSETGKVTQFAVLELEYRYENFFLHGHPHNQVDLLVCWDFDDDEVPSELRRHDDWDEGLFEYRNHETFLVLSLSRFLKGRGQGG